MIRSSYSPFAAVIVGVAASLAGCDAKGPEALPPGADAQAGAPTDYKKAQAALVPKKLSNGRTESGAPGPLQAPPR